MLYPDGTWSHLRSEDVVTHWAEIEPPQPKEKGMFEMPNPTKETLNNDVFFEAIWQCIKSWDINVPEYYQGYCGANGSHVQLILNALRKTGLVYDD
jgi:hypothetical protein